MKRFIPLLTLCAVMMLTACVNQQPNQVVAARPMTLVSAANPNRMVLPENYRVYVLGKTVLNHPAPGPFPGFQAKVLPTVNFYKGDPGCYIVCYSHNATNGIYPVTNTIFVNGQIRVPGYYQGRVCQPYRYVNQDISKANALKYLCQKYIPSCQQGNCWAGGDSGGWFGIQR